MYLYGKCIYNYELHFFYDLIIIVTRKGSQATVVTATITMLYLINMAQPAIQWQLLQSSFVDSGETQETIFITNYFNPPWAQLAMGSCTAATNILADGLLVSATFTILLMFSHLKLGKIWKCFHLWDQSLLAISLPSLFLVAETGEISLREQETLIKQANCFSKGYTQVGLYFSLWSN